MLKYLFFDFDGVLLNSEPIYQKFWIEACKYYGYNLSIETELSLRSQDHQMTAEFFKKEFGENADYYKIVETRKKMMDEYLKGEIIPAKDGAFETLKYIKENTDYKIAIVSSSSITYVKEHSQENNILQFIDKIISVRGLPRGKPFPDVYLKALLEADISKDEVVVFEDSPNGVRSAYNAGLRTIFIKDLTGPTKEIKEKTIYQLDKITEVINILNEFN